MLAVIEDLGAPMANHGGAMTATATVASTGSASIAPTPEPGVKRRR